LYDRRWITEARPSAGGFVVPTTTPSAVTYQKLAVFYDRKGQPQQRDRFLVLAADAAQSAGNSDEAETFRLQLLRHNPHHLLRPFSSFAQAMSSADVQSYLNDLRNSYPPKKAAEILASLGPAPADKPSQAASIPPTQPVVDLDAGDSAKEPLKVYRARDEVPPAGRPGSAGERPRPGAPAPPPKKQPTPAAPKAAPIYSLAPETSPRPHRNEQRRLEPASESSSGAWLGTVLFVVVLTASLALCVYTLAGPAILKMR
jgi:hypothetical protein